MIVCTGCRHANQEDAQFCAKCGRSLEPVATYMLSTRRAGSERPPIEFTPRKAPSKVPAAVLVGVLAAAVIGVGAWLLFQPDPCRGTNFTSDNFGYCLTVPEGWTAERARFGSNVELDQFAVPAEGVTVIVEAVDLEQGADLQGFVGLVRRRNEEAGLVPGPASDAEIDGVAAQAWDMATTSDSGTSYQLREVVVVRDDVGWRITLNDVAESFDQHAASFQDMLVSWRFR